MKMTWIMFIVFPLINSQYIEGQKACYEIDINYNKQTKIPLIYQFGWSEELILNTPKGNRPEPQIIMNQDYIEQHLKTFHNGASLIIVTAILDHYGRDYIGTKNGLFVVPKSQMDILLQAANGSLSVIEKNLGIPQGRWLFKRLSRIDILNPQKFNLRIPSGNEAGVNHLWKPGGLLPNGMKEAIIDMVPKNEYQEVQLNLS
ncbi:unnamed protein product [Paramecium pentaurelia]|uniref:Uncharacterized protein n=1 Tax=Paramecium pentaurelia TaxID=43138 RepID=A0A8S1VWT7_9CILI|nr:unnamed protein product [Paramecium pentaurelia]